MSIIGDQDTRHACAACKHQRKKCESNCVFAPHFPPVRANQFRDVHKIFGVKNMTGILEGLNLEARVVAVRSLEWEASAWKEDPVEGPLGLYRKLERRIDELTLKNQQLIISNNGGEEEEEEPSALIEFNPGASTSDHQVVVANHSNNNSTSINPADLGYSCNNINYNNSNFAFSHENMSGYNRGYWQNLGIENPAHVTSGGGSGNPVHVSSGGGIGNPVHVNYQSAPYFSVLPQGQQPQGGRMMIRPSAKRGRHDTVAQTTAAATLLPKQDVQRGAQVNNNNSEVRPVNPYNQGQEVQRGAQVNNNTNSAESPVNAYNQGQYHRGSRVPGRSYSVYFDGNLGGSQGRGMQ